MVTMKVEVDADELAALRAEVKRAQAREVELLENNTKLVEQCRANNRQARVREFFVIAEQGADIRDVPCVPEDRSLRLGLRLVLEEVFELLDATTLPFRAEPWLLDDLKQRVTKYIERCELGVDLPKAADAVIDSLYVLEGVAVRMGCCTEKLFAIVHAANMEKGPGPVIHGKKSKPPGWEPPDIRGALYAAGWRG